MGQMTFQEAVVELIQSTKFKQWGKPRLDGIEQSNISKDHILGRHYSVAEVSKIWGISVDFVRDLFKNEPDVLALERTGSKKYVTLRIPEAVLVRVHQRLSRS